MAKQVDKEVDVLDSPAYLPTVGGRTSRQNQWEEEMHWRSEREDFMAVQDPKTILTSSGPKSRIGSSSEKRLRFNPLEEFSDQ